MRVSQLAMDTRYGAAIRGRPERYISRLATSSHGCKYA